MNLDLLKNVIEKISPVLGTALGGPAGGIVGTLISNLFGSADEKDLINKIQQDPDAQIKLKELEQQHEESLQQIEYQKYVAELNDTANARNREIQTHDWVPAALSMGFLVIYVLIQTYAIYNPGTQDDVISARVQDILLMIIGYYFGSSHNHKGK